MVRIAATGRVMAQVALYKCMYYYKTSYIRTFFSVIAAKVSRARETSHIDSVRPVRSLHLERLCGYVQRSRAVSASTHLKKKTRLFVSLENCLYLTPRSRALSLNRGPSVSRLASSSRSAEVFRLSKNKKQNKKQKTKNKTQNSRSPPSRTAIISGTGAVMGTTVTGTRLWRTTSCDTPPKPTARMTAPWTAPTPRVPITR